MGNSGKELSRLAQSKAETKNEHARISLVNKVYEFILLFRAECVTDDRHLTMRRELHRTHEAAGLDCPVADAFQNKRPALLEVLVS